MVGTITPLVQTATPRGLGMRRRSASIGCVYVISSIAGAMLLATGGHAIHLFIASARHEPLTPSARVVAAIFGGSALYLTIAAWLGRRNALPSRDVQVPLAWRERFGAARASVAYGLVLGFAITTRINSPAVYLVPIASVLAPTWQLALLPALFYGFARGAAVIGAVALSQSAYARDPRTVLDRLGELGRAALGVQVLVLAGLVGAAGAILAGSF